MLDEADQDATTDTDRRFPDGMSMLSQLLRMGREYGIMAVIGVGQLAHMGRYVISEPTYKLFLSQSDAASIQIARNTLQFVLPVAVQWLSGAVCVCVCVCV